MQARPAQGVKIVPGINMARQLLRRDKNQFYTDIFNKPVNLIAHTHSIECGVIWQPSQVLITFRSIENLARYAKNKNQWLKFLTALYEQGRALSP